MTVFKLQRVSGDHTGEEPILTECSLSASTTLVVGIASCLVARLQDICRAALGATAHIIMNEW